MSAVIPVADQRAHRTTYRALKVTSQVEKNRPMDPYSVSAASSPESEAFRTENNSGGNGRGREMRTRGSVIE